MISDEQRSAFARLFYQWALADWDRERSEGYPYLKSFKCGYNLECIALLEELSPYERAATVRALVKYLHQEGAQLSDDPLSEDELRTAIAFRDEALNRIHQKYVLDETHRKALEDPKRRLDRRRFRSMVCDKVARALGVKAERLQGGLFRYRVPVDDWIIITTIFTGGDHHDLSYSHDICHCSFEPDSREERLLEHTSIASWLGLRGPNWWSFLLAEDAQPVSDLVASLCGHFVRAAREILRQIP